jgi:hypothetical protein
MASINNNDDRKRSAPPSPPNHPHPSSSSSSSTIDNISNDLSTLSSTSALAAHSFAKLADDGHIISMPSRPSLDFHTMDTSDSGDDIDVHTEAALHERAPPTPAPLHREVILYICFIIESSL